MSYEMLQDKLIEAIRGYYPNGKVDVREVFLALKMIEISLQATFIQTVAQGVLNTKEPAAQSGEGAPKGEIPPVYVKAGVPDWD